jgi:hypothetical protein
MPSSSKQVAARVALGATESDPLWEAFSSLAISDQRTPAQKARWEAAIEEIKSGQYERPGDRPPLERP